MFLSKRRSNGIYYLWYEDDLGRRQKVSTRCARKSDALKVLRDFKGKDQQQKLRRVPQVQCCPLRRE